jgi:hypothetical protein
MMLSQAQSAKTLTEAGGEFNSVLEAVGLPEIEFDQAKVDRELKAKADQADALKQAGGPNGQSANGQTPKEKVPA